MRVKTLVAVVLVMSTSVFVQSYPADAGGGLTDNPSPTTPQPVKETVTASVDGPVEVGGSGAHGSGSDGGPDSSNPCTPWVQYDPLKDPWLHALSPRADANGELWYLYLRTCIDVQQTAWIKLTTSADAAAAGHAEVTKRLPHLAPQLAPPLATGGIVNVNTWIGLDPPAPVSVTATLPGLWATVTAAAYDVLWTPGDGSTVDCGNLGVVWHPGKSKTLHDAPCGWTPKYPSLPKFTNTDDLAYHGHFDVTWRIIWTGSDGRSGTYDDIVVTTPTIYKVSEIQTIGDG